MSKAFGTHPVELSTTIGVEAGASCTVRITSIHFGMLRDSFEHVLDPDDAIDLGNELVRLGRLQNDARAMRPR